MCCCLFVYGPGFLKGDLGWLYQVIGQSLYWTSLASWCLYEICGLVNFDYFLKKKTIERNKHTMWFELRIRLELNLSFSISRIVHLDICNAWPTCECQTSSNWKTRSPQFLTKFKSWFLKNHFLWRNLTILYN